MFMARKVIVCLSLFTVLLIGAITLDRQLSREFYDPSLDETPGMVQVQQLGDGSYLELKRYEIFAPREYVRIISSDGR
jgi:hypothetical protein